MTSTFAKIRTHTVVWLWLGLSVCPLATADDSPAVDFQAEVLPILSDYCFECHGVDASTRQADLRLDQQQGVHSVFAAGSLEDSPAWQRIVSNDESDKMPPVGHGKSLSAAQIETLREWIVQGATWQEHWAFTPINRPRIPDDAQAVNPVDYFVQKKLAAQGLKPSRRADRETLIRRLSLDLNGLPPTAEHVEVFLSDYSPSAYDRLVSRLMLSPHYGEHMAVAWLDAARYADTNGYQNDFPRTMWPWRDWVIDAYNSNMPFDQFSIEQLAGDMLPDATDRQIIATGFNRNNRTVTEAGSIEQEWHVENVVDRVETFGNVWLGLTVGCARCHDHKFDPITQKDFYQLFAFFNNVNEKGFYSEIQGNVGPQVVAAEGVAGVRRQKFRDAVAEARRERDRRILPEKVVAQWLASTTPPLETPWEPVWQLDLAGDLLGSAEGEPISVRAKGGDSSPAWGQGPIGTAARFAGKQYLQVKGCPAPESDEPFTLSLWASVGAAGVVVASVDTESRWRGVDLEIDDHNKLVVHFYHDKDSGKMIEVATTRPIISDGEQWAHVAVSYDGSSKASGVKIYINGRPACVNVAHDALEGSITHSVPLTIGSRNGKNKFTGGVKFVRAFAGALSAGDVRRIGAGDLAMSLRGVEPTPAIDDPRLRALCSHWIDCTEAAKFVKADQQLRSTLDELMHFEDDLPTVMVMEELPKPRDAYVLKRGRYDMPDTDQPVSADVPDFLPPITGEAQANRLALARWLFEAGHPLTARVQVNRLWQQFFGRGLVASSEDLGLQGARPTHPELLDWLAAELIESDWDLQHVQRLIVTSETYRQSSRTNSKLLAVDPGNELLSRGPRHRLSAEMLRDNALRIGGLLNAKIGGPPFMPYQPEGVWDDVAGAQPQKYEQSTGDELYRRSVYIYRRRTASHPMFSNFDAPAREICQVRRARTNTPLQALALLNDPTFVESARGLALRMITLQAGETTDRLMFAFRLCTGRPPTDEERVILQAALEKHRTRYREHPDEANAWLSAGDSAVPVGVDVAELAAFTAVANLLLNLDETITKH